MTLSLEKFKNPGKEYRGVPFWSLNDELEDKELRWQIAEMDEKGWGGFFLHAREILITPYLSKEWMDRLRACIEEAERRGMGAWLYDEDRWPSGFAGGIVPAMDSRYRAKALMLHISDRLFKVEDAIRVFKCRLVKDKIEELEVVKEGESEEPGKVYLYFVKYTAPVGESWFTNFCYIDTLNPEAVDAFIEVTYEAYYKEFGKWFGSVVPGIFTDEPNFISSRPHPKSKVLGRGPKYPAYFLPWTDELPRYFKEKNGYDLLDHLPSLFFDVGNYRKVRYDYWRTVTDMFLNAYSKKLYEWCDKHNLKYTGHYLAEDTLLSQLVCIGAAMPHYEYMHVPGVDHLGRNIEGILTMKQVSSVANQLGRNRVLSETYGCSGQNLSFEDRKWIGDWEYVLGINLLNHHLSLYSMRGARKRDYPPNLFWQQPWWKYNRLIEDYFTRLSYVLSQGIRIADVLVIHPIGSAWALYTPLNDKPVRDLDKALAWLLKALLELKYDFELGDEQLMEKYGRVSNGELIIGRAKYKVVIVPPSVTLAKSTIRLLTEFIEEGGTVIAIKPYPELIDGEPSEEVHTLFNKVPTIEAYNEEQLIKALSKVKRRVEVLDENDKIVRNVWYHLRREGKKWILFLANIDKSRGYKTKVRVLCKGKVEEWNPFNGEIKELPCRIEDDYLILELNFPPVGSHLIVIDEEGEPSSVDKREELKEVLRIKLPRTWKVKKADLNALTLDYCRVRILKPSLHGEVIDLGRVPTWKAHRVLKEAGIGTEFELEFEFNSEISGKGRELFLVIEDPEKYSIEVNGTTVKYRDAGFWVDKSFRKIDIAEYVKEGKNVIKLRGVVDFRTEIESCYIVGDFAVRNIRDEEFVITEKHELVEYGNLVYQGYPFFVGTLCLSQEFEISTEFKKVVLEIVDMNCILTNVLINGEEVGQVFLRPHEIDITNFVKKGKNEVELQLVTSLRNLLGPHHHKAGELYSVGPGSFMDEMHWTDKYNFVPLGFEEVVIKVYE